MSMRDWLLTRIRVAERTAQRARFAHVRERAAERVVAYRLVLRQLERSGLDLSPRFTAHKLQGG